MARSASTRSCAGPRTAAATSSCPPGPGPTEADRHDSPAHVAAHFLSGLLGPSDPRSRAGWPARLGEFQRIALAGFEGPTRGG